MVVLHSIVQCPHVNVNLWSYMHNYVVKPQHRYNILIITLIIITQVQGKAEDVNNNYFN